LGLVAIASATAGAAHVLAAEIDHFAAAAIASNARLNELEIEVTTADLIGVVDPRWQVVTAGDVCYEQPMAGRVASWLRCLARRGCIVLLGDPGRPYLPTAGLRELARYACRPAATSKVARPAMASSGKLFSIERADRESYAPTLN
jgi:predicted nicotinamide N-methyase